MFTIYTKKNKQTIWFGIKWYASFRLESLRNCGLSAAVIRFSYFCSVCPADIGEFCTFSLFNKVKLII